VCTKDTYWSMRTIYDPSDLPGVSTVGSGSDGVLQLARAPATRGVPVPNRCLKIVTYKNGI
jgi:hypothetical protein